MKLSKAFASLLLIVATVASCATCIKSFRIETDEIISQAESNAVAIIDIANSDAEAILADADEEASQIISNANKKAEEIKAKKIAEVKAKAEAEAKKKKLANTKISSLQFPLQISDKEREYLYRLCWSEAGDGGKVGMQAVCWTILNRVVSPLPWFPDTIEGVIFDKGQYDVIRNGDFYDKTPTKACKAAVDEVLAGEVQDITGGATYFVMPGFDDDPWWDTLIYCGYIGGHNFYKDPT